MAKQLTFSTEGGTARTELQSIVDNQVLPLLKDTFGSAFTAAEGDRLRDSLLDPDSTKESKIASIDAFYNQLEQNIETSQRELEGLQSENILSSPVRDTTSFGSGSNDLESLSIEDLIAERARLSGGQ